MKYTFLITAGLFLFSCGEATENTTPQTFTEKLESAHHKTDFLANDIIQFDMVLKFRGTERLNGTLILNTSSENGIIREKNGDEIIFKKDKVYYKDRDSLNAESVRFKAYTWPYFFLYPYKLTDPGTKWEDYSNKHLNDDLYLAEKLSFESGTGDSPDDWYVTYADTSTHLVYAAAYIVTFGASQDEAEEDPHAIVYENYKDVNGIPLSHSWTFWAWRDGQLTEQLGEAELSNFSFKTASEVSFDVPDGYAEI